MYTCEHTISTSIVGQMHDSVGYMLCFHRFVAQVTTYAHIYISREKFIFFMYDERYMHKNVHM